MDDFDRTGPGLSELPALASSRRKEVQSLTDRAYAQLRREILSCRLEPGSEVSEADLAERLSMSKTPVRDALGRLRAEGFVKTFPRRGYLIVPLTISDMNEMFDMRSIVEAGAAELAVERITAAELDALERLADASYDESVTASLDMFVGANRDFHIAIARASGNGRLVRMAERQLDELERFFYVGAKSRDVNPEVRLEHRRIVDVLRRRDRAAAREIAIAHNEGTRRGLMEVIASGRRFSGLVVS
jgi:DNA-binding GntR family transcriptional regulator